MAIREMTGAQAFYETLKSWGVKYIFGVPGTTEVAMLDALVDEKNINYVLTTHESVAVSMADGYSRITGEPSVVSLHTNVGLANGIGQLHNAKVNGIPVLVCTGVKNIKIEGRTAFTTSHDIQESVKQYTKWDWMVLRTDAVSENVTRALKVATAQPTGPVFLALPEDVMAGKANLEVYDAKGHRLSPKMRACPQETRKAVELLLNAERPLVIAGSDITRDGGWNEMVTLADKLGVPVAAESRLAVDFSAFPTKHRQYVGPFNPNADFVKNADVIVALGMRLFTEFVPPAFPHIPPTAKLVHMCADAFEVGKIYPVAAGLVADASSGLKDLLAAINEIGVKPQWKAAQTERAAEIKAAFEARLAAQAAEVRDVFPIKAPRLATAIAEIMDDTTTIVSDGITSSEPIVNFVPRNNPKSYYSDASGGCIGWGPGAALGVKLGDPSRKVIGFVGDGVMQMEMQALWTAAKYNIPVTFVVANNSMYAAVKAGLLRLNGRAAQARVFPGSDISGVDYAAVAEGFGVKGFKVTQPNEIVPTIKAALAMNVPTLVDVVLDPQDTGPIAR